MRATPIGAAALLILVAWAGWQIGRPEVTATAAAAQETRNAAAAAETAAAPPNSAAPAATAPTSSARSAAAEVPYPEGYRSWHHVKSMLIEEGHPLFDAFGGIHHIYANDAARRGYDEGRFEDGSVIVFDLLEALPEEHAIVEGARKVLGVMHKDSARFADTGGWGFEGFAAGDPARRAVGAQAATACFGCHAAQAEHDYVFSRWRE